MLPILMTVKEVKQYLNISENAMYLLIADGAFPKAKKICNKWLIPESDVIAFVNN